MASLRLLSDDEVTSSIAGATERLPLGDPLQRRPVRVAEVLAVVARARGAITDPVHLLARALMYLRTGLDMAEEVGASGRAGKLKAGLASLTAWDPYTFDAILTGAGFEFAACRRALFTVMCPASARLRHEAVEAFDAMGAHETARFVEATNSTYQLARLGNRLAFQRAAGETRPGHERAWSALVALVDSVGGTDLFQRWVAKGEARAAMLQRGDAGG